MDDYHGVKLADPYRYLEDPDADETKAFVQAQNELSAPFIASYPYRDKFNARLESLAFGEVGGLGSWR